MTDPAAEPVLATTLFRPSAADITAAQRKHMRWLARRGRTWIFLGGFALICAVVVASTIPNGWTPIVLAAAAAGGIGWMVGWGLIVYAAMPLVGRHAMKAQPNLRHQWRVEVSEHGLRAVTPNQDNSVAWADYPGWSEDARVILFYQSDRLFQFVPKRGLDPGFLDAVRRLAAHLPKR